MTVVTPIDQRKDEHIKINLDENVHSGLTTGFDDYTFDHQALPEIDLSDVDASTTFLSKTISAPILISSMTGGSKLAGEINQRLAEAAGECNIAMSVGSQRPALVDPKSAPTFTVRKFAKNIPLIANLGAIQLNNGMTIDDCKKVVDMIEADALYLHLNPLQEALQEGGDTNWQDLRWKIEQVCRTLPIPVFAKEVGFGISERTARILIECGIAGIDVAGAGGTSWSQVESYRTSDPELAKLARSFIQWGIPTTRSIQMVKNVDPTIPVIASGGIRNGIDIAKAIAMGAILGGMAGEFLKAATTSTEDVLRLIHFTKKQLVTTMFVVGAGTIEQLASTKLHNIKDQP